MNSRNGLNRGKIRYYIVVKCLLLQCVGVHTGVETRVSGCVGRVVHATSVCVEIARHTKVHVSAHTYIHTQLFSFSLSFFLTF